MTSLLTAIIFIFIASYLSVFDRNIILIIEYTYIIKFTFITLGIASGLAAFVYSFVQWFILDIDIRVRKVLLYLFIFSVIAGPVWGNYALDKQAGMCDIADNVGARKCLSILPIQSLPMKPKLGSISKLSAGRMVLFARTAA